MQSRSRVFVRGLTWRIVVGLACGIALAILGSRSVASGGILSFTWMWPVDDPHPVVREYWAPASEYGAGHRGIDVAAAAGAAVRSPANGRILFAGDVAGRGVITIEHDNDVVSTLEPVRAVGVAAGDSVTAGDVVGIVAPPPVVWDSSHLCECLHLGARYRGEYVSPRALLEQARVAVLKPWGEGPRPSGVPARMTP